MAKAFGLTGDRRVVDASYDGFVLVEKLEADIVKLDRLLLNKTPESEYQALFESGCILQVLGYRRSISTPRLPLKIGRWLVPDFLVQNESGIWEVLDLKVPEQQVMLAAVRRERFTADLQSYIAQVEEYDEYFDDSDNRSYVLNTLRADVQKGLAKVLIVGRDGEIDRRKVHQQLRRRGSIRIVTYDDVVNALLRRHSEIAGAAQEGEGFSCFLEVVLLEALQTLRGYLFDFHSDQGNRLSLYLDERRRLVLELTTHDGDLFRLPVDVPSSAWLRHTLVNVEVGTNASVAFLRVRLDDDSAGELALPRRNLLSSTLLSKATIGSDDDYRFGGSFNLYEFVVYNRVLQFRERVQLVKEWFYPKRLAGGREAVQFRGEQGLEIEKLRGLGYGTAVQ